MFEEFGRIWCHSYNFRKFPLMYRYGSYHGQRNWSLAIVFERLRHLIHGNVQAGVIFRVNSTTLTPPTTALLHGLFSYLLRSVWQDYFRCRHLMSRLRGSSEKHWTRKWVEEVLADLHGRSLLFMITSLKCTVRPKPFCVYRFEKSWLQLLN